MFAANNRRGYSRRWVAIRQASSELLFCVGLVVLPALVAIDMSVWLGCQHLNRTDCADLLVLSVAQMDFPAGASP